MNRNFQRVGTVAVSLLALASASALAEIRANTHELHGYVGALWGDDLTDRAIGGSRPEMDDEVVYGIRWAYHVTDTWGFESSLGYSPTAATGLEGRDIDLDLVTLDVNGVYHFHNGTRFIPYITGGVGYAWADLDQRIEGTVNEQAVSLSDDSSFSLNAGAGVKYFATDQLIIRLDARYRYIDSLVDRFDDSLSTVEATLGIGWRF